MEPIFFASPAELRDWFDAHHEGASELWLGYYKKHTGRPTVTWAEAVDEALCVGWIDGLLRRIDDESHMQRFTPRKPASTWSNVNVENVARLRAEGRMRPAGEAAFARRSESRSGTYSFEQDPEQAAAAAGPWERELREAHPEAWPHFSAQPAWYRRAAMHHVASAKREATRRKRFEQLVAYSAEGRTIPALTRP